MNFSSIKDVLPTALQWQYYALCFVQHTVVVPWTKFALMGNCQKNWSQEIPLNLNVQAMYHIITKAKNMLLNSIILVTRFSWQPPGKTGPYLIYFSSQNQEKIISAEAVVDLFWNWFSCWKYFLFIGIFPLLRKDRRAFCQFSVTYFSKGRNKFHHNCRGFYVSKAILESAESSLSSVKAKSPKEQVPD